MRHAALTAASGLLGSWQTQPLGPPASVPRVAVYDPSLAQASSYLKVPTALIAPFPPLPPLLSLLPYFLLPLSSPPSSPPGFHFPSFSVFHH